MKRGQKMLSEHIHDILMSLFVEGNVFLKQGITEYICTHIRKCKICEERFLEKLNRTKEFESIHREKSKHRNRRITEISHANKANHKSLVMIGKKLHNVMKSDDVIPCSNRTIELKGVQADKTKAESLIALGKEFLKEKKVDDAISCSNIAIEKDPDNIYAWSLKTTATIAKFHLQSKDKRDENLLTLAHSYVQHIHDIDSECPSNIINEGIIFYELGDYDKALQCFNLSIDLSPEYGFAWYNRGVLLLKLNNLSEAKLSLEMAAKFGYEEALLALNSIKRKRRRR